MRLINRKPSRVTAFVLGMAPFVAAIVAYAVASHYRRLDNPADKLLPSLPDMAAAFSRMAFTPDRRSGDLLLWMDTFDSLERLAAGMGVAVVLALSLGILIGFIPHVRSSLAPFIATFSLIPPITILPILFIIFGLGEVSKVVLIVIGITPFLIRDMSQRVIDIPHELIVKAQTLGASSLVIALRVALPQVMPRLIQAVRLSLGPAWLFLIAAEAIASDLGLGYRIFLVRRYLAMDVILTYVIWITLLAFVIDWALRMLSRRLYPWAGRGL